MWDSHSGDTTQWITDDLHYIKEVFPTTSQLQQSCALLGHSKALKEIKGEYTTIPVFSRFQILHHQVTEYLLGSVKLLMKAIHNPFCKLFCLGLSKQVLCMRDIYIQCMTFIPHKIPEPTQIFFFMFFGLFQKGLVV